MNKLIKFIGGTILSFGLMFSFGLSTSYAQKPNADVLDVSHHNSTQGLPLSFYQTIKQSNVKGVVVKVSEGQKYLDRAASVNIANATRANLSVSAYHFARFTSIYSAKKEALFFDTALKLVGFDKSKNNYVILDIEDSNLTNIPFDLTTYTNTFLSQMRKLGYTKIDLYSGSYFYNNRLIPSMLTVEKSWLASYPSNAVHNQPTVKFPNGNMGSWQWSSNYTFNSMTSFGRFDITEDYANKLSGNASNSTNDSVGKIGSVSLINYMKSKNMDSSYTYRSKLAKAYGIENYKGTAAQNLALLSKLKSGVKPAKVDTSKLTTKTPPPVQKVKPVDNEIKVDPKVLPKTTNKTTTITKIYTYKVKSGDSLWTIAKSKHTTVNKLVSLNKMKNPNVLKIGQVIKYPTKVSIKVTVPTKVVTKVVSPTPSKSVYYIVQKNDFVGKIANTYHVSASQIKLLNKLDSHYTIYIGQKLKIK